MIAGCASEPERDGTGAKRRRPRGTSFGGIDGLAFDDEGKLYVFDGRSLQIVVADPEGGFVRAIGGKGDGRANFVPLRGRTSPF